MPPSEPDWAILPDDVWRAILLAARRLQPQVDTNAIVPRTVCLDWLRWWHLVARMSSTCTTLREAFLGPGSAELWQWTLLQSVEDWAHITALPQAYLRGAQRLLLSQARLATSAQICGICWEELELQAAVASLASVQELSLCAQIQASQGITTAALAAIPSTALHSLSYQGPDSFAPSPCLQDLRHLRLELIFLSEKELRLLACWLPRLQRIELAFIQASGGFGQIVCSLELLSLLPADELGLELEFDSHSSTGVGKRLRQLVGVQLHSLDLCLYGVLNHAQEQLLFQCQVTHSVVLRWQWPAQVGGQQQLLRLPSGASVEYRAYRRL